MSAVSEDAAPDDAPRGLYRRVLGWAFSLLNGARLFAYLPTLWAIHASGDSSQHSLWTWGIWLGANATMALWLFEQQGRRLCRATVVSLSNSAMCLTAVTLILIDRW